MKSLIKNTNEEKKINILIFISPLIVMGMLMIVYYLKGIYPFGKGSVSYYDMSQNYIPIYYHTFDVLHGDKACFWDWYSGLGGSMSDIAGNYIYNPINIFFLFVKRNRILESMSFFLMLKLMIAATAMSFYVSRKIEKNNLWIIWSGILYASCGYILQYYSNIHFLDIVMMFPFLMWSYERLMNRERGIIYILIMALCLSTNIYMMFMVSVYLVLKSFVIIRKSDKKKKIIEKLGEFTILAIMLSAFSTIPTVLQLLHSTRIFNTSNNNYLDILTSIICFMKEQKAFMIYGSECIIAVIVCLLLIGKRKTRKYIENVIMIAILLIPIAVESVNILWHTGSYQHFPMRFGYILSFEFICLGTEIVKDKSFLFAINIKIRTIAKIISIAMFPMTVLVLVYFLMGFREYGIRDLSYYHAYGLIALLLVFFYIVTLLSSNRKVIFALTGMMILCQAFFGYYGFIAPQKVYSLECTNDIILKTEQLKNSMKIEANPLSRIKNSDTSLNANYPFVLERGAVSNWTFGIDASLQNMLRQLGYSTNYTRLLDSGGTVFTDALLGIRNVFTKEELDENLCTRLGECKEGYYYFCNYQLPFGCILKNDIDLKMEEASSKYDIQNVFFESLTDIDKNLITTYNVDDCIVSQKENKDCNGYRYVLEIPVENKSVLYLHSLDGCSETFEFQIDGKKKEVPFLSVEDNCVYPAAFNNGILECGVYEHEIVELVVDVYGEDLSNLAIGCLDLEVFEKGISKIEKAASIQMVVGKDFLNIIGKSEKDGLLFLPIGYNDGWNVKMDGPKKSVIAVLSGSFCAIPIQKGELNIHLYYVPRGLKTGIILSVLSVIMILFMVVCKKDTGEKEKTGILTMGLNVLFYLLVAGIILFMYVLPVIAWGIIKVLEIWIFGF